MNPNEKLREAFKNHGAFDVVCEPCDLWVGMINLRRYTPEAAAMLPPLEAPEAEVRAAMRRIEETLGARAYVSPADLVGTEFPFRCQTCGAHFKLVCEGGSLAVARIPPSDGA